MQLLLAYAFDRVEGASDVPLRLGRVTDYYTSRWRDETRRSGLDVGRIGLHVWDVDPSPWRWPSWQREADLAVATLYLPVDYQRLVGAVEPARAAVPLARALIERPSSVLELTAPFVVASVDPARGRLRLHTDGIGLGRLYELRFPGGWVWSNRPAAACRFAGVRAEPDRDGWRMFAATGWFQGDRTPFSNVYAVPGGATIGYDPAGPGRTLSVVDALATWSAEGRGDGLAADRVEEVAESLRRLALSLDPIWSGKVVLGLSGGRDSRLCAAAVLAAGLEVQFVTNGAEPGEADVAERLVAALPAAMAGRVSHRIDRPKPNGPAKPEGLALRAPVLPNVLAWHRLQEGLRPESYLPTTAPGRIAPAPHLSISGAAGEIAHGHFYPPDHAELAEIRYPERLDAFTERLAGRIVRRLGLSAAARLTSTAQIRRTLDTAFVSGLGDAKVLDYFYLAERLRRWGTTADRAGTIVPLLVPEFIRAAFDITPAQRRDNALHRAVTTRLIPQWRDEPYYRRPAGLVPPVWVPRLGRAVDRDLITAIVADRDVWADAHQPAVVTASWQQLLAGRGGPGDERLLHRVLWRAVFADYLAEVNEESTEARIPLPRLPGPAAPPPRTIADAAVRGRRFAARGLRRVARAVDPTAAVRR
ncbi:hypothetical protein ABNF97_21265 [Plantactinospora sp. B6F1]|uniref:hypothetical protein n=1 Tax=Plantactinospora sp. B6F1 TaxID=3158971 RepID=UPI00102AE3DC